MLKEEQYVENIDKKSFNFNYIRIGITFVLLIGLLIISKKYMKNS